MITNDPRRELVDICAHRGCKRDAEDDWGYCEIHWAERRPHLTRASLPPPTDFADPTAGG